DQINGRSTSRTCNDAPGRNRAYDRAGDIRPSGHCRSDVRQMKNRASRKRELVLAVFAERSAALPKVGQIHAGLCIGGILIVDGQKPVSLRADVTNLEKDVAWQFTLNGEVVLRGVLRPQGRRKLSEEQNRPVKRPVHRLKI